MKSTISSILLESLLQFSDKIFVCRSKAVVTLGVREWYTGGICGSYNTREDGCYNAVLFGDAIEGCCGADSHSNTTIQQYNE